MDCESNELFDQIDGESKSISAQQQSPQSFRNPFVHPLNEKLTQSEDGKSKSKTKKRINARNYEASRIPIIFTHNDTEKNITPETKGNPKKYSKSDVISTPKELDDVPLQKESCIPAFLNEQVDFKSPLVSSKSEAKSQRSGKNTSRKNVSIKKKVSFFVEDEIIVMPEAIPNLISTEKQRDPESIPIHVCEVNLEKSNSHATGENVISTLLVPQNSDSARHLIVNSNLSSNIHSSCSPFLKSCIPVPLRKTSRPTLHSIPSISLLSNSQKTLCNKDEDKNQQSKSVDPSKDKGACLKLLSYMINEDNEDRDKNEAFAQQREKCTTSSSSSFSSSVVDDFLPDESLPSCVNLKIHLHQSSFRRVKVYQASCMNVLVCSSVLKGLCQRFSSRPTDALCFCPQNLFWLGNYEDLNGIFFILGNQDDVIANGKQLGLHLEQLHEISLCDIPSAELHTVANSLLQHALFVNGWERAGEDWLPTEGLQGLTFSSGRLPLSRFQILALGCIEGENDQETIIEVELRLFAYVCHVASALKNSAPQKAVILPGLDGVIVVKSDISSELKPENFFSHDKGPKAHVISLFHINDAEDTSYQSEVQSYKLLKYKPCVLRRFLSRNSFCWMIENVIVPSLCLKEALNSIKIVPKSIQIRWKKKHNHEKQLNYPNCDFTIAPFSSAHKVIQGIKFWSNTAVENAEKFVNISLTFDQQTSDKVSFDPPESVVKQTRRLIRFANPKKVQFSNIKRSDIGNESDERFIKM